MITNCNQCKKLENGSLGYYCYNMSSDLFGRTIKDPANTSCDKARPIEKGEAQTDRR